MWDDLFEKSTYWRYVIWYDFNNFCVLETINVNLLLVFHTLKGRDITYFPNCFHLIHLIHQSSSIHFMYQNPTHSFRHSFPFYSIYRSWFISFTFTIVGFTHAPWNSNLTVSFIFLAKPVSVIQAVSLGKI